MTTSESLNEGEITELPITEAVSGEPVEILTTFQNTGNHDFKVKGEVTIKDSQGQTLATIPIPLAASSLVPGVPRQLKATFIPQGELPLGSTRLPPR